jgi:hypothetical protein
VADLARVAGVPALQQSAVDDDAAADPELAAQVDHVVVAAAGSAQVLGERREVAVVPGHQGNVDVDPAAQLVDEP